MDRVRVRGVERVAGGPRDPRFSDGDPRIADNRFEMIIRGFLKIERPDKSTLRIVDDVQRETLLVRYVNRNTVSVHGTFRCGDAPPARNSRIPVSLFALLSFSPDGFRMSG